MVAVHGRTAPANPNARRRRTGPADIDAVALVKAALDVPVLVNGNVRVFGDADPLLAFLRGPADGPLLYGWGRGGWGGSWSTRSSDLHLQLSGQDYRREMK